ncbi:MAG: hypothetical protein WCJ95_18140 [Mariniphaga sp.]
MNIFQRYINLQNNQYVQYLDRPATKSTIFVVIPCYDEPDIVTTLNSLANSIPPKGSVTVLIVVNDAENSAPKVVERNILTLKSITEWRSLQPDVYFQVQLLYAHALPSKWAGVGWARKLGMDEAVRQIANNGFSDGIIVSLDADCTVSSNYLHAIEGAFNQNPKSNFFLINFEHPLDACALDASIREGIIRYELHMRYYRNALQWSGYPHAIHTVGSSFALKASAYVKQGGMNRRKAGEDFYFLHKLILLGHYGNIQNATVFPASRISDRVPFGTGAALKKWEEGSPELNTTYSLEAFSHLKPLFNSVSAYWSMENAELENSLTKFHPILHFFCNTSLLISQLLELKNNCSNASVFIRRFFHQFNAFWILKYLNFAHENSLIRNELSSESRKLLYNLGIETDQDSSLEELLRIYRKLDREITNNSDSQC